MRSMFLHCIRSSLICCLICLAMAPLAAQENWPEFRGPTADGHTSGPPLPMDLDQADRLFVLDHADNALKRLSFPNPGSEAAARDRAM